MTQFVLICIQVVVMVIFGIFLWRMTKTARNGAKMREDFAKQLEIEIEKFHRARKSLENTYIQGRKSQEVEYRKLEAKLKQAREDNENLYQYIEDNYGVNKRRVKTAQPFVPTQKKA